jgi:hypothetical protein
MYGKIIHAKAEANGSLRPLWPLPSTKLFALILAIGRFSPYDEEPGLYCRGRLFPGRAPALPFSPATTGTGHFRDEALKTFAFIGIRATS